MGFSVVIDGTAVGGFVVDDTLFHDFVFRSCSAVAPGDSISLQPSVRTKRRVVVRASEMSPSFIFIDAPPYSYQGVP